MADITQQTPASEHDGFIYGLKYNHNCISVYYIMLGTNMAIL